MGWKKWPYWLKGGIISSSAVIITIIYHLIGIGKYDGVRYLIRIIEEIVLEPLGISDFYYKMYLALGDFLATTFIIIFALIFYFLIGAIIGWIVDKIKIGNL